MEQNPKPGGKGRTSLANKSENSGLKCLTEAELQEKLRKGKCFRCEKFGPNHHCKNKQHQMMLMGKKKKKILKKKGM